jgi:hypothetical protein
MSSAAGLEARHIRGLVEKIWNALAPSLAASIAAPSSDPAIDVCIPIRNRIS